MDAKPMTPADAVAVLRSEYAPAEMLAAADCIDAQAAEITALRAERVWLERDLDAYLAAHDRRMADINAMQDEMRALRAERDQLSRAREEWIKGVRITQDKLRTALAERDALAARLAVPGEEHPVAWVIPGDDNANVWGSIDAMAWQEGEFSKPLYDGRALTALRARVAGLEGALTAAVSWADNQPDSYPDWIDDPDWVERARAALSPSAQEPRHD